MAVVHVHQGKGFKHSLKRRQDVKETITLGKKIKIITTLILNWEDNDLKQEVKEFLEQCLKKMEKALLNGSEVREAFKNTWGVKIEVEGIFSQEEMKFLLKDLLLILKSPNKPQLVFHDEWIRQNLFPTCSPVPTAIREDAEEDEDETEF